MQLAQETRSSERGFAMAGLLVGIALLSLGLSVAMPTWKTLIQREKEEELIWRGQQYDRAIQLYRKKNAAPGAPSLDHLVQGRFLRKKYKDPITGGDFEVVGVGQAPRAAGVGQTPRAAGVRQPQRGFGQLIGGVRSKSTARSFRVLDGRSTYNEWQFTYVPWKPPGQPTTPGGPQQRARPGSPGARPGSAPGRPGMPSPPPPGAGPGAIR
jgi:type II secretory pathway pseudopilin PulG